jgi:hypothetical protein
MTRRPHYCHARGCFVPVRPSLLMCAPHWRMVPREVQQKVLRTYRRGQEQTKTPSREYIAAALEAVNCVARAEKQAVQVALDEVHDGD